MTRPRRRVLRRIERCLAQSDPQLEKLFWIFTRLAGGEQLPRTERVAVVPVPAALRRSRLARAAHGRVFSRTTLRSPVVLVVTLFVIWVLAMVIALEHGGTGPCSPPARHLAQAPRTCPGASAWPAGK